jgi:hypothetical protein
MALMITQSFISNTRCNEKIIELIGIHTHFFNEHIIMVIYLIVCPILMSKPCCSRVSRLGGCRRKLRGKHLPLVDLQPQVQEVWLRRTDIRRPHLTLIPLGVMGCETR